MSIKVENVSKYWGHQKALDDVSFTISRGEVVGFLGPNGAGKSTMMKIITGYIPASSGRVLVDGHDVKDNALAVKRKTGYLPENNPLYHDMYVKEYLGFMAGVYRLGKKSAERISNIIDLTGLTVEQHKKIGALSKGYRQRVGLAQALIHDPDILILDEPTSGLDPNQIIEIRNLISLAGAEKTVLLSTHIMQEVEAVCDRIIIIDKGRIKADNRRSEIFTHLDQETRTVLVEFDLLIAEEMLGKIKGVTGIKQLSDNRWLLESASYDDIRPLVFRFAVDNGLTVLSMNVQEQSLEEVFRILTRDVK
jgi:ABC-2 type transport system ATP-binding protein